MSSSKQCFFIAPIGDDGSEIRERSDKLMEYIIEEAVSDYNYSVIRADQMDQPGSITNQIIQKTVNSDLVVADLTGHNPNVFYELAVRHATGKPCIQLINRDESIPFDISDLRTIQYGLEVEEAQEAREEIEAQLELFESGESEFDNPISRSAEMQSLRESDDPTDQNLADVLQGLSKLNQRISNIEKQVTTPVQQSFQDYKSEDDVSVLDEAILRTEDGKIPQSIVMDLAKSRNKDPKELKSYLEDNGIEVI